MSAQEEIEDLAAEVKECDVAIAEWEADLIRLNETIAGWKRKRSRAAELLAAELSQVRA